MVIETRGSYGSREDKCKTEVESDWQTGTSSILRIEETRGQKNSFEESISITFLIYSIKYRTNTTPNVLTYTNSLSIFSGGVFPYKPTYI